MLGNIDAIASLAVKDLDRATRFYHGTLGLEHGDSGDEEVVLFTSGHTKFNVYRSEYAGTNQATALTWSLGSRFDETLRALKGKGIAFEHYDLPGLTRVGDVHQHGEMKVAWFKDPDGNILNITNL